MLHDAAEPIAPSLELTALLAGPGSGRITIHDAPPNLPHQATVQRDGRTVTAPEDPARMARVLEAMLAPSPEGWSVNGVPARIIKPPLPNVAITLSMRTRDGWRTAVINGKPDLMANCRVEGLLTWLPGLCGLAVSYACELPSGSEHWSPAGRVQLQPMPVFTAAELGLDREGAPDVRRVRGLTECRAQQHLRQARRTIQEAKRHPLTPAETKEPLWIRPQNGRGEDPRCHEEIIIVHGAPVRPRYDRALSWAERTSALIALEMSDTDLVSVSRPHGPKTGGKQCAGELDITLHDRRMKLAVNGRQAAEMRMPLLARGRYRPERRPAMPACLEPGFRPEADELADLLVRCYGPDLEELASAFAGDPGAYGREVMRMSRLARETAASLLGPAK